MKRTMRRRKLLFVGVAGVMTLGLALPTTAFAADTLVTLAILEGALSITAPPTAGSLGSLTNSVSGGVVNGSIGPVQVNDARGAPAGSGWVASVISTAFTPLAGPTIAASAVGYTVGAVTKTGTATYTANDPANLTGVSPAVTATGITGTNSATWNPTLNVAVPGGTAAGLYNATVTHSVL